MSTIYTVEDIKTVANNAGSFFFSPDTMKFFSSRVLEGVYAPDGYEAKEGNRFLFVTSERYDTNPRHYAVRMMTISGGINNVDIITVGGYHDSARAAKSAAQKEADTLRYLDA